MPVGELAEGVHNELTALQAQPAVVENNAFLRPILFDGLLPQFINERHGLKCVYEPLRSCQFSQQHRVVAKVRPDVQADKSGFDDLLEAGGQILLILAIQVDLPYILSWPVRTRTPDFVRTFVVGISAGCRR